MNLKISRLPNRKLALFILSKENKSHIKIYFEKFIDFGFDNFEKRTWIEFFFLRIKVKKARA